MMAEPADDSYPEAWTPPHVREMRAVSEAVEQYVANLSDEQFADLAARTRPGVV
ncbi:hypothetical protein [Mycolicibacterium litorale]|uniref:Uncharacterized protein n=1 Tax=Mycolicibacterium litorale TaxID=758802 RepID=A0AAD1IPS5_9MYCO|nr:hypothetical protein [Mycolicibacterium litorale]MCV7417792.1 hypothetical protein [Mycolicibacterium litorale]TDY06819.1 hypothetical protein BCL50_3155 [Mycolicibacterium litorale]BBY19024.1 hypothetical protein MLIT_46160 [Mycolicibacterium litorale]